MPKIDFYTKNKIPKSPGKEIKLHMSRTLSYIPPVGMVVQLTPGGDNWVVTKVSTLFVPEVESEMPVVVLLEPKMDPRFAGDL